MYSEYKMGSLSNAGKVIMSANNNEEVHILPTYPQINITSEQANEPFEVSGWKPINLIGDLELQKIDWSSRFPSRTVDVYKQGAVAEPMVYVDFINRFRIRKVPFRLIVSRPDGRLWFNKPVTVDNFNYYYDRNGDIVYTINLTEYVFAGKRSV